MASGEDLTLGCPLSTTEGTTGGWPTVLSMGGRWARSVNISQRAMVLSQGLRGLRLQWAISGLFGHFGVSFRHVNPAAQLMNEKLMIK
jgi:hypothetical protein